MTQTRSIRRKWPGRWPNWALRSSPLPSFPCWILQTKSPLPTAFGLGFRWFGGRCGGNCRGGPPIRRPWQSSQRRGWLSRHTAPRLSLRRRKVRLSPFPPDDENCARSLAPPLQRKPTPLGFALGAPSAAYIISEFGDLAFPFWERLCCGGGVIRTLAFPFRGRWHGQRP